MAHQVSVSSGELLDRISILSLKIAHSHNSGEKLALETELSTLVAARNRDLVLGTESVALCHRLDLINKELWHLEADIRTADPPGSCSAYVEAHQTFMRVRELNDERSALKARLNRCLDDTYAEVKIYQRPSPSGAIRGPNVSGSASGAPVEFSAATEPPCNATFDTRTTGHTGEVAQLYDMQAPEELRPADHAMLAAVDGSGSVLEVGCGTGRLLLRLGGEGRRLHGLDASEDMLSLCGERLHRSGVQATLHKGLMQDMKLEEKFRYVLVPYCAFNSVSDPTEAAKAMSRLRDHLTADGILLLSVFAREDQASARQFSDWRHVRSLRTDIDTSVHVSIRTCSADADDQTRVLRRFDVESALQLQRSFFQAFTVRSYTHASIVALAESVGLEAVQILAFDGDADERTQTELLVALRHRHRSHLSS